MKNSIFIYSFCIIMTHFLYQGCCFDDLYYSDDANCKIRIYIDWSSCDIPLNGTTAYVYHANGEFYKMLGPFSNPYMIDFSLPKGEYNMLLHNNTPFELQNLKFSKIENAETFEVSTIENNESKHNKKNVLEPNVIALAHIYDLYITEKMINYYPNKPSYIEHNINKEIKLQTEVLTSEIEIRVNVKGLNNAAGAPISELRNLVEGIKLMSKEKTKNRVNQEFILNNRTFNDNSKKDGFISKKLISFGFHDNSEVRYILYMNFILVNGDKYPITMDITDKIKEIEKLKYKIEVECTLPNVPSIGDGDSGFNPDIEEWEDIEVDVPM